MSSEKSKRPPIVDWDKVRALAPDMYKGTPYDPGPPAERAPQPEIQLQGVDPKKSAAAPPPRKQAPPEAVARKPAPSPASEPAAAPGPAPAQVAAGAGATGAPAPAVPRGTPASSGPARVPPEYDKPAFHYASEVQAGVDAAMRRGRPDIAARIQGEYADLITGQFRAMESQYEVDTLPQVQAMRQQLLDHQGAMLPTELATKAREVATQAAAQQRRMLAYAYGLERNALTAGSGVQLFNQSKLIEPGVTLDRIEVRDGNLVGLDANGQPVNFLNGTPFVIPVDQAEALYQQEFESDRKDYVIVPDGGMAVNTQTGSVIAHNEKDRLGTPSEQLSAVKAGSDVIATAFGAKMDKVSRMIDPESIKDQAGYTQALAEMEALVRQQVPPMQAANIVAQKWRAKAAQPAAGTAPASSYTGPVEWRQ